MAGHRFFISPQQWTTDILTLDAEESHHCADVVRLGVGDAVTVFDGQGREAQATITSAHRKAVALAVTQTIQLPPRSAHLALAQAIPKGKNMELIIEKAVELGASEIFPLLTDRTVVRLDETEARKKQEKWQRIALEACKQSGQSWLPQVHAPQSLTKFLTRETKCELQLVAALHPSAQKLQTILTSATRPQRACVLVGPEGDFSPAELAHALTAGYQPWSLGSTILRAETAALFCLSVLGYELLE
jgi:16S rRNA (uracil1498-N3)-methyltransferase